MTETESERVALRTDFDYERIKVPLFPRKDKYYAEKGGSWRDERKEKTIYAVSFIHYFLKDIVDDPEFYDFLNRFDNKDEKLLNFYLNCQFYHYCDTWIKGDESALRSLVLILIVDGILHPEYKDFYQWLKSENRIVTNSNLDLLYQEYKDVFGSERGIKSFFRTYFSQNEKIELLASYQFREAINDIEELYHICFNECQTIEGNLLTEDYIDCLKHGRQCPLKNSEEKTDQYLNKLVDQIYDMRSNVVHKAQLVRFTAGYEDCLYLLDAYYKKEAKSNKYTTYAVNMTTPRFSQLVRKACYKFLNK
jgi:hypothetical protein